MPGLVNNGAGGWSSSLPADSGFEVVAAVNHWDVAVATHQRNNPSTTHFLEDISLMDMSELADLGGSDDDLIMTASPACQGHSPASQPKRRVFHDALRSTAHAVIDAVEVCRPIGVLVENVPAFQRWKMFDWWCDGLRQLGYTLDIRELTASRFGVPQRRKRLFVIATRDGQKVRPLVESLQEPAFGPCLETNVAAQRWSKVSAATPGVQKRVAAAQKNFGPTVFSQWTTGHRGVPLSEPLRTVTTAPCHWNPFKEANVKTLDDRLSEMDLALSAPTNLQTGCT